MVGGSSGGGSGGGGGGLSGGAIAGIVIGAVVGVALICIIALGCCFKSRTRKSKGYGDSGADAAANKNKFDHVAEEASTNQESAYEAGGEVEMETV